MKLVNDKNNLINTRMKTKLLHRKVLGKIKESMDHHPGQNFEWAYLDTLRAAFYPVHDFDQDCTSNAAEAIARVAGVNNTLLIEEEAIQEPRIILPLPEPVTYLSNNINLHSTRIHKNQLTVTFDSRSKCQYSMD